MLVVLSVLTVQGRHRQVQKQENLDHRFFLLVLGVLLLVLLVLVLPLPQVYHQLVLVLPQVLPQVYHQLVLVLPRVQVPLWLLVFAFQALHNLRP
jgi:hypothetical protein